jgi:integrase
VFKDGNSRPSIGRRERSSLTTADYPTSSVRFGEAAREWLRYIEYDRRRRPSTLRDYRHVVRSHLIPEFGESTPIDAIRPELIEAFRERLVREAVLSPRTINKILTILQGVFRRAVRTGALAHNPASEIDRQPVRTSGDFRVLAPAEIQQLLLAAATPQDAAIFALAAFAGLRVGELRALRWTDVNFELSLIHVRRSYTLGHLETPKSGRVRSVPLIAQAAERLLLLKARSECLATEDLVFIRPRGGFIDDSCLRRRFYQALAKAGLSHMRVHDLRHTFGTLAVQAFPLPEVAAFMGHADITTTMIYIHHLPKAEAAARLGQVMAPPASRVRRSSATRLRPVA